MTYKIEVHSEGYEDTFKVIHAETSQKAKSGFNMRAAILEWCEHNDIDLDDNFDLPFTRITRLSNLPLEATPANDLPGETYGKE